MCRGAEHTVLRRNPRDQTRVHRQKGEPRLSRTSPDAKGARRAFVLRGRFRRFFSDLGPGLITGAADDDPSGITTYSVTGAAFGYSLLWTAIVSFPLMAAVQIMCARLGR